MNALPTLTSLATLLVMLTYFWTLWLVGNARKQFGVKAPAVTGHEQFERCFRVQNNTIEQMFLLFPVMWLCAFWVNDLYAAIGGAVWCVGRILYGIGYMKNPASRAVGFYITALPAMAMLVADAVVIVRSLA